MKIEDEIHQQHFESPIQKALVNIMFTHGWLMAISEEVLKDFSITPQQFNVLRILRGRYPRFATAGEIKEVMLDKNPDLTRLCDRLQEKGMLERNANPDNRRQVLHRITKSGMDTLAEIDPFFKKKASQFSHLTDQDAVVLSDLLDKLRG